MRPVAASTAPLLLIAVVLAGCSSSPGSPTGTAPPAAAATSASTSSDPSADPAIPSETGHAPPECDGILFETGAVVPGKKLGDCMAAAMFAAGSGSHRVDSSDGESSTVQFEWTPEFSMSVAGANPVVVRGDSGWVQFPGRGWVKSDPSSTVGEVVMATTIIKLIRVFGDPRTLAAGIAQSDWRVVDEGPVPAAAADAVSDVAWELVPVSGSVPFGPVTISDYHLWLGQDYLGVYAVGTGSMGDVAVTTSNTFLQWGESVEIPDPTS